MKDFLRQISPTGAFRDLLAVWQTPGQNRWLVLGAAMAMTFCMAMLFIPESKRIEPRPPEVFYITTWASDRTEQEIIASNCHNQELKDALEARLAEREEFRRDIYRALGRATFIDVDAIEAEVEADQAREAAATPPPAQDAEPALSVEEYCARALA
jgi:hypothetical protein